MASQVQGTKTAPVGTDTLIIKDSEDADQLKEIHLQDLVVDHSTAVLNVETGHTDVTLWRDAGETEVIGTFSVTNGVDGIGTDIPQFVLGTDYTVNNVVKSNGQTWRCVIANNDETPSDVAVNWEALIAVPARNADQLANPHNYFLDAGPVWRKLDEVQSHTTVLGVQQEALTQSTLSTASPTWQLTPSLNTASGHEGAVSVDGRHIRLNPEYTYSVETHLIALLETNPPYNICSYAHTGVYGSSYSSIIAAGKAMGGIGANDQLAGSARQTPARAVISGKSLISIHNTSSWVYILSDLSRVVITCLGKTRT